MTHWYIVKYSFNFPTLNLIIINEFQVLRSSSCWSCGFLEPDHVEQSIHEAYVQTISRAQHYVYIENQFFITLAMGNDSRVKNQIGEALYKRIMRAHRYLINLKLISQCKI